MCNPFVNSCRPSSSGADVPRGWVIGSAAGCRALSAVRCVVGRDGVWDVDQATDRIDSRTDGVGQKAFFPPNSGKSSTDVVVGRSRPCLPPSSGNLANAVVFDETSRGESEGEGHRRALCCSAGRCAAYLSST